MRNKFSILLLTFTVSLIGLLLAFDLNYKLVPDSKSQKITVRYFWPDVPARVIESEVGRKLEASLASISGIVDINSETTVGSGQVELVFAQNVDIRQARLIISGIIKRTYKLLPQEVSYPEIIYGAMNTQKDVAFIFAFTGSANKQELTNLNNDIVMPAISAIKGVDRILVSGVEQQYISIVLIPEKLMEYKLSQNELIRILQQKCNSQDLGEVILDKNNESFKILVFTSRIETIDQLRNIQIPISKNLQTNLSDIAQIEVKSDKVDQIFKVNGENTLTVMVYPKEKVNLVRLSENLRTVLASKELELNGRAAIRLTYDSSEYIKSELGKLLTRVLGSLIILLVFTYLATFSSKYTFSVFVSLFVNLLIAAILFYVFKIEIHIYTMVALTVSFGILIDNSIVVIENFRTKGHENINTAVLAATFTTIVPLVFVLFTAPETGNSLIDFSIVMIISVSVSVPVGLFFIPAFIELIHFNPSKSKAKHLRKWVAFNQWLAKKALMMREFRKAVAVIIILFIGLPVFLLPQHIESGSWFADAYNATLGTETYQKKVKPYTDVWFGGTLRLFHEHIFKYSSTLGIEQNILSVYAENREGGTSSQMAAAFEILENNLKTIPEIASFVTEIADNKSGSITIYFKKEYEFGKTPGRVKNMLIKQIVDIKGFDWSVIGYGDPYSNATYGQIRNLQYTIIGYDLDNLFLYAEKLKALLEENNRVESVVITSNLGWKLKSEVETKFMQFDIHKLLKTWEEDPNYFIWKMATIQDKKYVASVGTQHGILPVFIDPPKDVFYMYSYLKTPFDGENMHSALYQSVNILSKTDGFDIYRENRSYRLVVEFNYRGSDMVRNDFIKHTEDEFNEALPLGYKCKFRVYGWQATEQNYGMMALIIFMALLIISAVTFESLSDAILVPIAMALSVAGAILTFVNFKVSFDQGGFASLLFVAGVSVNSVIYLINKKRSLPAKGMKQIIKAAYIKFIPIVLTVFSTIMGLLPFVAFSGEETFWTAFAYGSIGGLAFSFPAIFLIFLIYAPLEHK